MENKKNILIVILIIIIAILCGVIGWVFGSKFADIEANIIDNNKEEQKEETKKYTAYKQGQEIKLSDNSEWLVLKDSNEDSDYVVLLSKKEYVVANSDTDDAIFTELTNKDTKYENSSIKQFVDSLENQMPVTLKEVDGYKIRLITIDEIFAFDNNWNYDSNNDTYTYTGLNLNENFKGIQTMTDTKCTEGKCTAFYNLSETQCLEDACNKQFFLEHWIMGVGGIKPVINVNKESLNK